MTQSKNYSFQTLLEDIFTVFKKADHESQALGESALPVDFYEPESDKVVSSFAEYCKENENFKTTSITEKYESKKYSTFFEVHHDIKVVASSKVQKYKVGSTKYNDIDFFYKFSTELLLRETSRVKVALFQDDETDKPKSESEQSELESQLSNDFNKITYSYNLTNGEAITYISKSQEMNSSYPSLPTTYPTPYPQPYQAPQQTKQPLFSSLTGKSTVDPRSTIVPDPYQLAKVIPQNRNSTRSNTTLENLSPAVSKIPPPTSQPTEILSNFFHPNWYTIHVPTWLTYKSKALKPLVASSLLKSQREDELRLVTRNDESVKSFAPSIDSKVAVITAELKGSIWLNHLGFREIHEIKKRYLENKGIMDIDTNDQSEDDTKQETDDKSKEEPSATVPDESQDVDMKDNENGNIESTEHREINVADLVQWDPLKIEEFKSLENDKDLITKSPRHLQNLISTSLIRLNKMRQERYLRSNPNNLLAPSKNEIKLYNKITRLITLSIELNNLNTSKLSINFSKRLPVLMSEYTGTLPGMPPSKIGGPTSKSTRLPSIRGPYKKKNRQL